jgi:hypothetical protein
VVLVDITSVNIHLNKFEIVFTDERNNVKREHKLEVVGGARPPVEEKELPILDADFDSIAIK